MFWVFIAYVVATPFAVWIELATEREDCIEERFRRKASGGFKSVAWMFDSGAATWHMLWAILFGPIVVGFMVVAFVVVFPICAVSKFVFGVELLDDEGSNGDTVDARHSVG